MTILVERLSFPQETAQEKLALAKQRYKEYYDKKSNHQEFKIGDFIWLQSGPKPPKFENQYSGPYLIIEVWSNGNVALQIKENKTKVLHSYRLRFSHVEPPAEPENSED